MAECKLYKTTGRTFIIDPSPEVPPQPQVPPRVTPGPGTEWILEDGGLTAVGTDTTSPAPGGSPPGGGGDYIYLSDLIGSGGGVTVPPGAIIIDDL